MLQLLLLDILTDQQTDQICLRVALDFVGGLWPFHGEISRLVLFLVSAVLERCKYF